MACKGFSFVNLATTKAPSDIVLFTGQNGGGGTGQFDILKLARLRPLGGFTGQVYNMPGGRTFRKIISEFAIFGFLRGGRGRLTGYGSEPIYKYD